MHLVQQRFELALDRMTVKGGQQRIVILPGIRRQAGLSADLLQESLGVKIVSHRHDGKQ